MAATKKRKPDAGPLYTAWDDVDAALRDLREIDARVAKAELKANALRSRADEELAAVADDLKQKKQLEKNMEEFCTAQLPEMPQKSRKLNHGTIQFTASKECVVLKGFTIAAALQVMLSPMQSAVDKLVEKLAKRYVRVKFEIDKAAAMADFNARQTNNDKLGALGLGVEDKDNFGYTLADKVAQPTT